MRMVLVFGRTLAVNDLFHLRYSYMVRSGESMTLKKFSMQYAYVTHFYCHPPLHDRLLNKISGYGGASYGETGRIALGGNNKRWVLPTV
jgi:hypothetical protein